MDERFSGRQAGAHGHVGLTGYLGYLSQSKLRLVRYRGEAKTTCATPAKLTYCFAMDVWTPLRCNLGNADLLNRTPRYLPLATGKRWRSSRATDGLEAGWLPNGRGVQ